MQLLEKIRVITGKNYSPVTSRIEIDKIMFEYRLFPGDQVVNIFPHRDSNGFLIPLNAQGVVEEVNDTAKSVTILWPSGAMTTVNVATVTQPSIVLRTIR